jgi:fused signal recognition particle receptor
MTAMSFADRLKALFRVGKADDALFEDLADLLVEGDLGASLAFEVSDELKASCGSKGLSAPEEVKRELKSILARYGLETRIEPDPGRLSVFLVLGVNGVGKTTSCAKLAQYYRRRAPGSGIVLAAGDTFRAAAIDQLKIHGERLGLRVVAQKPGSDPGAVLWDAVDAAKAENAGLVLADTAGRMHTRADLLRELGKIDKIVAARAEGADYRRLLVLDSTTGQNALRQAETFSQAVKIDGILLSKQDSSAKGGMAIRLAKDLGLPTAFVGTGEGYDDLAPFSLDSFLDRFLGIGA